jgi:hypothetical protein
MFSNDTQGRNLASRRPLRLWLFLIPLIGATLGFQPAGAASRPKLPAVSLTYRGGRLIEHVKVATLFWGSSWKSSSLGGYFNSFFRDLFADGRFTANLAQYSAGGYTIGSGSFAGTGTDTQNSPAKVTDAQIRTEILAQVAAGHLPKADADTVYFVFTAPGVVVTDSTGASSLQDFVAYHDYRFGSDGFAYAVVPCDSTLQDPRWMTLYASHELAEAITDPEPYDTTLGWYDDYYGEVADIAATLYDNYLINDADFIDELDASDGNAYLLQKVWSNQDKAPVALAAG